MYQAGWKVQGLGLELSGRKLKRCWAAGLLATLLSEPDFYFQPAARQYLGGGGGVTATYVSPHPQQTTLLVSTVCSVFYVETYRLSFYFGFAHCE